MLHCQKYNQLHDWRGQMSLYHSGLLPHELQFW
nr:MAG TPA: hypothetical protein [Caudoviricetes sp.]